MKNSIKAITLLVGLGIILVSCNKRATCDAYGYMEYNQEKQLIQQQESLDIISTEIIENEMM
ncbi:MAG: hypothetical protein H3C31_03240 [Brumimicrobium sp.]|nr:hypothetical protein [Brumimicrobium sp.]MCO5268612.1 hypothetical protein [Brumimicrobium sp.]